MLPQTNGLQSRPKIFRHQAVKETYLPGRKRANTGKRRVIASSEENGKSKHSQLPTTMNGKKRKPTLDRRLKVGQKGGQEPRGTFSQAAIVELNGRLSWNPFSYRESKWTICCVLTGKFLLAKKGLPKIPRSQAISGAFIVLIFV